MAHAVEGVLNAANQSCKDRNMKDDLQGAAKDVSESLNRLLDHIR